MRFLQRVLEQLKQVWLGMGMARRVGFVFLSVLCLATVIGVGYWASQPDYRVLYSGLSVEDAGAITAKLQSQNTSFRLSNGGTTIQVPAEQVQQLRLDLAAEGLPTKGGKGFELLDGSSIGLTPFLQQVNYGRALQTELAKTIMGLEPVAFARVHIVRPESTPFVREQKPTTASVVLKLKPNATLNASVAASIVALVSGAVEGLKPENVTVLDTSGRILSAQNSGEVGMASSSAHLDMKRQHEAYLAKQAEDMLATYLGPGHAIVRVTADMKFTDSTKTREEFDANPVVKTEKTINHKSTNSTQGARGAPGPNPRPTAGSAAAGNNDTDEENVIENFPPSSTKEVIHQGGGNVERLTVAAMIDLSAADGAKPGTQPLTLAAAQELIQSAVGFKKARGDEIKVSDVKLAGPASVAALDTEYTDSQRWQNYANLARNASLGVAALVALVLGWLFIRRIKPVAGTGSETATAQGQETQSLQNFSMIAQRDPEAMAQLLSAWLEEPEQPQRMAA